MLGWTKRLGAVLLAAAAVAVTGCGSGGSDLDAALCSDLYDGLGLHQIRPADMAPEEFAVHVNSAVTDECPDFEDDVSVRFFLENWGYR